jgi:hypothetical protein
MVSKGQVQGSGAHLILLKNGKLKLRTLKIVQLKRNACKEEEGRLN